MKTTVFAKIALSLLACSTMSLPSMGMEKPSITQKGPSFNDDMNLATAIHKDLFSYKEKSYLSKDFSYKYPTILDKIKAVNMYIKEEIEKRTKNNLTASIPQFMNCLVKIMIDNIGGWTKGTASYLEGETESQHLVLAHFVSDLMQKTGMSFDDKICSSYERTGYVTSVNVTCRAYLSKNLLSFKSIPQEDYRNLLNTMTEEFPNARSGEPKKTVIQASSPQSQNKMIAQQIYSEITALPLKSPEEYIKKLENIIKKKLSGKNADSITEVLIYLSESMMKNYDKIKNSCQVAQFSGACEDADTILLITFSLENAMRKIYYDKGYIKYTGEIFVTNPENLNKVSPELKNTIYALYKWASNEENINAYDNYKKNHIFSANAEGKKLLETIMSLSPSVNTSPILTQEALDEQDHDYRNFILDYAYNKKLFAYTSQGNVFQPTQNPKSDDYTISNFCYPPAINAESYKKSLPLYDSNAQHMPLPPGTYAKMIQCTAWIQTVFDGEKISRAQGIKIHVSAKPETALKIAKITLPILESLNIPYKVMYDLRQMRALFYLLQYERKDHLTGTKNQSTQAGKFIAIYPRNDEEAITVMKLLDEEFLKGELNPSDFEKLLGDTQIGNSGGIFARFGKFSATSHKGRHPMSITPIDPLGASIRPSMLEEQGFIYDPRTGMIDERKYPWPDYMNDRKLYAGNLFGDLTVKWTNPNNETQSITWETRPNCWAELDGGKCGGKK